MITIVVTIIIPITHNTPIGLVTLKRTFKDETVEVLFDCQDETEIDYDEEDDDEDEVSSR